MGFLFSSVRLCRKNLNIRGSRRSIEYPRVLPNKKNRKNSRVACELTNRSSESRRVRAVQLYTNTTFTGGRATECSRVEIRPIGRDARRAIEQRLTITAYRARRDLLFCTVTRLSLSEEKRFGFGDVLHPSTGAPPAKTKTRATRKPAAERFYYFPSAVTRAVCAFRPIITRAYLCVI